MRGTWEGVETTYNKGINIYYIIYVMVEARSNIYKGKLYLLPVDLEQSEYKAPVHEGEEVLYKVGQALVEVASYQRLHLSYLSSHFL